MKKTRPVFDTEKSIRSDNPVYISKILDPYTAKIARIMYNFGFSADLITFLNILLGTSSIIVMLILENYLGLVIAAILLTLRNIGDTIDGKIARGSGIKTSYGGFLDIVSDWIFFHAAFFITLGYLTNHLVVAFLCITGYMSREFARRKFELKYGLKAKNTEESKKVSGIVSIVTKYDLANVFWIIPLFLLINQLALIIYAVAIIEYVLLIGELGFDMYCFLKKEKELKKSAINSHSNSKTR